MLDSVRSYGCKNYDGLQVQSMFTVDSWVKFAKEKEGYVFRQVSILLQIHITMMVILRTKETRNRLILRNVPFVTPTGTLENDAVPCMVLFTPKGEQMSKELIWKTIMDRREVGVLGAGKMMGPALYRNALELLLLDRIFLEEYFGDRVSLEQIQKPISLM